MLHMSRTVRISDVHGARRVGSTTYGVGINDVTLRTVEANNESDGEDAKSQIWHEPMYFLEFQISIASSPFLPPQRLTYSAVHP